MRASEGATWIGLIVITRILAEWVGIVEGTMPQWDDWYMSFCIALFIVVIATAVVRGRRFGLGGSPVAR